MMMMMMMMMNDSTTTPQLFACYGVVVQLVCSWRGVTRIERRLTVTCHQSRPMYHECGKSFIIQAVQSPFIC